MNIVFVGLQGVPYFGRACDPRLANTANLLAVDGDVAIVNRYSSLMHKTMEGIKLAENVKQVEVLKRRNTGGMMSALLFVMSILCEPFTLWKLHREKKIDYLHIYSGHYFDFVLYKIFAKLVGAKIVYEYVEYRTEKTSHPNLYHRINNRLCDFHGAKIWDSCIAISNFLEQKVKEVCADIPVIKVTPLCDFDLFEANKEEVDIDEPYLMFCGSAGYFDVVKFIIDSFNNSTIKNSKKLLLVLSGSDAQLDRVREYEANAIIRTKLPYNMLVAYYKHAFGLMIPLRNTTEDIARFPNKVCEYTAARGLIITTCYGEMPYYFRNGENAIVADDCTVKAIAKRLDEVEAGAYDVEQIRKNCYQTGLDNFSIGAYKDKLYKFLEDNR